MTSANGIIDRAARNADKLPLGRIVAAMLGVATAFFCFAMPQRVLDATLGVLGVAVPVGGVGRLLFILGCAALAAGLGWLAVTVAAGGGAAADGEGEIDLDPPQPRRRAVGPSDSRKTLGAPLPSLLAVRRGDGHPDAPPRRPIFADHDLPVVHDDVPPDEAAPALRQDMPLAAEFRAAGDGAAGPSADRPIADGPAAAAPPSAAEAEPQPADIAAADASGAPPATTAEDEPLDLTETLADRTGTPPQAETPTPSEDAPAPVAEVPPPAEEMLTAAAATAQPDEETPPVAAPSQPLEETPIAAETQPLAPAPADAETVAAVEDASTPVEAAPPVDEASPAGDASQPAGERPLAELMARLETGLDRHAGDLPPPPTDTVTPLHEPTPAPDDALRNALEALQRLAERQR